MSALLFVLMIADGYILVVSCAQFRESWANKACHYLTPLCGYPHALIIVALVLIGLLGLRFARRA
jgi:hypothetical protein